MRKLQVQTDKGWAYVLAFRLDNQKLLTTSDPGRALPSSGQLSPLDLEFFQLQFPDKAFRLNDV